MDALFTIRIHDGDGVLVECQGELDICAVTDLDQALLQAIHREQGDVRVDMARVRYIDSACVKALLAAQATLTRRGARLMLTEASPVVRRALRILFLDRQFGLAN